MSVPFNKKSKKSVCPLLGLLLLAASCVTTTPVQPFTVSLTSVRYEAGSIEAYFDKEFPMRGLQKRAITVFYYPQEDAVCLQFNVAGVDCSQFWSKSGRDAFAGALEQFKAEYEQKQLEKGGKGRKQYGSVQGFFTWRKLKVSKPAYGSVGIHLGYYLKEKAAFFAATQEEINYQVPDERRILTSPVFALHFTIAQAESLAALFGQEYL
ncbi:MAG: hypothetical protein LBU85_04260, partial [Treponema sp.]|nr:hypothetical protein [Treponema sp.]